MATVTYQCTEKNAAKSKSLAGSTKAKKHQPELNSLMADLIKRKIEKIEENLKGI